MVFGTSGSFLAEVHGEHDVGKPDERSVCCGREHCMMLRVLASVPLHPGSDLLGVLVKLACDLLRYVIKRLLA